MGVIMEVLALRAGPKRPLLHRVGDVIRSVLEPDDP
jgi:hypothetical protein